MNLSEYRDEPPTSTSMLARAREGDAESWKHLAQVYGPIVYGWARRCGCQSADAADVMQDTFESVARAISRFDDTREGATFRGWLWTITRNKVRDRARLAAEEVAVGGTAANLALGRILDHAAMDAAEPPTSADSDASIARRRVVEILRLEFDARSWKMFWETAVIGRPPTDVAEEMGVSKWAVYKARARVLQRLQDEMRGLE